MITNLIKNVNTYYVIVILGLLVYIFLHKSSTIDTKIVVDKQKYDSLQVVNQHKLDSISSFYNKKIDTINKRIDDANVVIIKNNQLIKSLQDAYNKEVPVINSYDVDALRVYFTNYKQQSDTITNDY